MTRALTLLCIIFLTGCGKEQIPQEHSESAQTESPKKTDSPKKSKGDNFGDEIRSIPLFSDYPDIPPTVTDLTTLQIQSKQNELRSWILSKSKKIIKSLPVTLYDAAENKEDKIIVLTFVGVSGEPRGVIFSVYCANDPKSIDYWSKFKKGTPFELTGCISSAAFSNEFGIFSTEKSWERKDPEMLKKKNELIIRLFAIEIENQVIKPMGN